VDASDMEMINAVVKDIVKEAWLSPLSDDKARLGQYSIVKVLIGLVFLLEMIIY
jgi:hypothetical protein